MIHELNNAEKDEKSSQNIGIVINPYKSGESEQKLQQQNVEIIINPLNNGENDENMAQNVEIVINPFKSAESDEKAVLIQLLKAIYTLN